MKGKGGVTVVLAAKAAAPGDPLECGCCGRRYSVKRTCMRLKRGELPFGTICPECVLQGPKGAVGRLKARFLARPDEGPGALLLGGRGRIDLLQVLTALKAAALEGAESFPLEARQAAAREMREKR
jgi:uncharacterized protein CbrC (UPF0167 family)